MTHIHLKSSNLHKNCISKNDKLNKLGSFNIQKELRVKQAKNDLIQDVYFVPSSYKNNSDLNLKVQVYFYNGTKIHLLLKEKEEQSMAIHNFLILNQISQSNYEQNYRILNNKIDNFFRNYYARCNKNFKETNNDKFIDKGHSESLNATVFLINDINTLHKNSTPYLKKEESHEITVDLIDKEVKLNHTPQKSYQHKGSINKKMPIDKKNNCGKIKKQFEINEIKSYFTPIKEFCNIRGINEIKNQTNFDKIIYNKAETFKSNKFYPFSKENNVAILDNQYNIKSNSKISKSELNKSSRMNRSNEKNYFIDKSETIQFDSSSKNYKAYSKEEINSFSSENVIQEEEKIEKKISSFQGIKSYFTPHIEGISFGKKNPDNLLDKIKITDDENDSPVLSDHINEKNEKRMFPFNDGSGVHFQKSRKILYYN